MVTHTETPPAMPVDFTDPRVVEDPWGILEEIRAAGPVVYNERIDAWMVSSYRNVARMLANARNFTTERLAEGYAQLFGGNTMQFDDTERHDQIKAVWSKQFQRDSLSRLREMVTEIVDQRLLPFVERMRAGEVLDARQHLTRGIPTLVIARMMGLPEERFEEFSRWSDAMGGILGGVVGNSEQGQVMVREGQAATAAMNQYLREVIEERRRVPSDDLVGCLTGSEVAKVMAEQDIVASVTQLVFAGNETTANLMAHILVALAEHPDQRRAIAADRSLVPAAIEETNRWQTPVALKMRHARNGGDIAGVPIPDGAKMLGLQIAANRDPTRWESPERFDAMREAKPHIGFGFGKHSCLGLNLARLEATIWLDRLLVELPEWELAAAPDYGSNFWVRGPKTVMIAAG
jgi:cytochrome P450